MSKENKKKRTQEEKRELNLKIAEYVWYSLGGIVLLGGLTFSVLGLLIMNMSGNFTKHPFYPLYVAQGEFFSWLGFGSSYANAGVFLILCAFVYFAIVFFIFAKRADIKEKKLKQRKDREKNLRLIIDEPSEVQVSK